MRYTNTSLGGLAVCETVGVAWAGGTKAHTHNSALGRGARLQSRYDDVTLNRDKCAIRTIKVQIKYFLSKVKVKKHAIMTGTAVNLKFLTQEYVEGNEM